MRLRTAHRHRRRFERSERGKLTRHGYRLWQRIVAAGAVGWSRGAEGVAIRGAYRYQREHGHWPGMPPSKPCAVCAFERRWNAQMEVGAVGVAVTRASIEEWGRAFEALAQREEGTT